LKIIMRDLELRASPLTAREFAPFGEVIEIEARESRWINDRTCRRYDDLAEVDVQQAGGRPLISIFEALPRPLPLQVRMLERHPLASQAFFPLDARPYLVVVAEDGPLPIAERVRAYWSNGAQGVNYRRNTWHHSLIALDRVSRFLVVDRGGPGDNCEEISVDGRVLVTAPDMQTGEVSR
jgi:ureidoglycolate lyase